MIIVINDDFYFVDENDFFFSLIASIPVVYGFYFIIRKIKYHLTSKRINDEIELEIEDLLKELHDQDYRNHKYLKDRFITLKMSKSNFEKEIYLIELLKLKDQFSV